MSPEEEESLNNIRIAQTALKNAFNAVERTRHKPEVAIGWLDGLIPSLNNYNTTVDKHNIYINNDQNKLKYATLIRSANGIYDINYESESLYFYTPETNDPYFKGDRIWRGGKRIKSKKRTKSRKIKKNAKKSKTRKR
jgi:hypothetical protein